jgi:RecA-family ATPase
LNLELADNDQSAPWLTDRTYGGMTPTSARRSWEAGQRQLKSIPAATLSPVHLANDEPPPPTSIEDYGLDAFSDAGLVAAPPMTASFVTPLEWPNEPPPEITWVARQRIPRGDVSTLDGDGGSGKTMAGLQLAASVARAAPDWFGMEIDRGPAVFLSAEEPEDEIRRRVDRIARRQGFELSSLRDLHFWFPTDLGTCTFAIPAAGGVMQPTPLFRALEAAIAEVQPALVVVDNVAAVYAGNQNDRVMARTFMNLWRGVARSGSRPGVLLLNHPSLSGLTAGTGRGGNMDWRNSVRSALHLRPAEDKAEADLGVRVLECVKNNYAPLGPPVKLRWVDGVLAMEGSASPLQRLAQDSQADDKFLSLLAGRNRLGRDVGDKNGRNYAPHVFANDPESGGYTSKAFARAMERLFAAGKIALEQVGPKSKDKKRIVIAGDRGTE